jgi:Putative prokaryotic signal transducing protein
MKTIKSYSTRVDADVAKIALAGAGIPAVVVGIGTDLEGGTAGVQLRVEDENVDAALKVLEGS